MQYTSDVQEVQEWPVLCGDRPFHTGASGKIRTFDRPSISRVLYQLSYACLPGDTTRIRASIPVFGII